MKFFILLSLSLVFSAHASEREGISFCDSAVSRVQSIQRELSEVSADIVRESGGPESYVSESTSSGAFNCEEVPSNYSVLISRRDRLMVDLKAAERERDHYCPRHKED